MDVINTCAKTSVCFSFFCVSHWANGKCAYRMPGIPHAHASMFETRTTDHLWIQVIVYIHGLVDEYILSIRFGFKRSKMFHDLLPWHDLNSPNWRLLQTWQGCERGWTNDTRSIFDLRIANLQIELGMLTCMLQGTNTLPAYPKANVIVPFIGFHFCCWKTTWPPHLLPQPYDCVKCKPMETYVMQSTGYKSASSIQSSNHFRQTPKHTTSSFFQRPWVFLLKPSYHS